MQIIDIGFVDKTRPITRRDLNTVLCFTPVKAITYFEARDAETVLASGVVNTDTIYTDVITNVFDQSLQKIAVFGDVCATPADITTALDTIANRNFRFVVSDTIDNAEAEAINEWCSANGRIFLWTPDKDEPMTDVVTLATGWNNENTSVFCHPGTAGGNQFNYAASIAGLMAPKDPGSATWAFKSPNGVPALGLGAVDETTALTSERLNIFKEYLGDFMNIDGRTTARNYIDIVLSKYFLRFRLEESIVKLFRDNDKIPFTQGGKALIYNAISDVVAEADRIGILVADETTIYVPNPLDLSAIDRANRTWRGIEVETRLQGAAHQASMKFTLSV